MNEPPPKTVFMRNTIDIVDARRRLTRCRLTLPENRVRAARRNRAPILTPLFRNTTGGERRAEKKRAQKHAVEYASNARNAVFFSNTRVP
ncbi:MAG TPA: hypothetical protein DEB39_13895 [Planctomycetaceae bacterium]|nr:hypothetical protein [Planctomycetaceae bacterium]